MEEHDDSIEFLLNNYMGDYRPDGVTEHELMVFEEPTDVKIPFGHGQRVSSGCPHLLRLGSFDCVRNQTLPFSNSPLDVEYIQVADDVLPFQMNEFVKEGRYRMVSFVILCDCVV